MFATHRAFQTPVDDNGVMPTIHQFLSDPSFLTLPLLAQRDKLWDNPYSLFEKEDVGVVLDYLNELPAPISNQQANAQVDFTEDVIFTFPPPIGPVERYEHRVRRFAVQFPTWSAFDLNERLKAPTYVYEGSLSPLVLRSPSPTEEEEFAKLEETLSSRMTESISPLHIALVLDWWRTHYPNRLRGSVIDAIRGNRYTPEHLQDALTVDVLWDGSSNNV
ncbi:hypothetical protein QE381_003049 [Microbacterium sp. SORGH_AS 888]|nr:hypothetical protein [Microbacterium sp. SORGH_AS_0888]